MLKPWKSIKIIADNKVVLFTHQTYFQERTEELPGESKKYTRLMSHSTASIASILKIRLLRSKKVNLKLKSVKKMQEIAITDLNAPNGS